MVAADRSLDTYHFKRQKEYDERPEGRDNVCQEDNLCHKISEPTCAAHPVSLTSPQEEDAIGGLKSSQVEKSAGTRVPTLFLELKRVAKAAQKPPNLAKY